jgi:hypothetical protein
MVRQHAANSIDATISIICVRCSNGLVNRFPSSHRTAEKKNAHSNETEKPAGAPAMHATQQKSEDENKKNVLHHERIDLCNNKINVYVILMLDACYNININI